MKKKVFVIFALILILVASVQILQAGLPLSGVDSALFMPLVTHNVSRIITLYCEYIDEVMTCVIIDP